MKNIDLELMDLLTDETKAYAFLGTIMPDGSPQVTPVWFNTNGEHILINSAKGRVKDENMRARPEVAMTIIDMNDPYRYLQVRGRVVEITEEGAREHISILSEKYFGRPYDIPEGEIWVIYQVKPV